MLKLIEKKCSSIFLVTIFCGLFLGNNSLKAGSFTAKNYEINNECEDPAEIINYIFQIHFTAKRNGFVGDVKLILVYPDGHEMPLKTYHISEGQQIDKTFSFKTTNLLQGTYSVIAEVDNPIPSTGAPTNYNLSVDIFAKLSLPNGDLSEASTNTAVSRAQAFIAEIGRIQANFARLPIVYSSGSSIIF